MQVIFHFLPLLLTFAFAFNKRSTGFKKTQMAQDSRERHSSLHHCRYLQIFQGGYVLETRLNLSW